MERREFTRGLTSSAVWATTRAARPAGLLLMGASLPAYALNESQAVAGVRAALERGAIAAIGLLGRNDGFLGNKLVRIPLPGVLGDAAKLLRTLGQGKRLDELVTAMNRAAEAAVPQARPLLLNAVKSASVEDALKIVRGSNTSVTDFFAGKTRAPLTEEFLPIVTQTTQKVSLAERYNDVAGRAAKMGLLKGDEVNVQRYVTQRALDGLYLMIGEEEKKIRADPLKTGSDLLRQVFGR